VKKKKKEGEDPIGARPFPSISGSGGKEEKGSKILAKAFALAGGEKRSSALDIALCDSLANKGKKREKPLQVLSYYSRGLA